MTSAPRIRQPAAASLPWWVPPIALAAALVALGSLIGLWYLPFAAGVVLGVATRLRRTGRLGFAACAMGSLLLGPVAWGVVLAAMSMGGAAIGATARIAAAIAGLPPLAALTIVLTLLIALLQSAAGLWLGRALGPRQAWTRQAWTRRREEEDGGLRYVITDNPIDVS